MTTAETFQKLSEMRMHAFAHALRQQLETDQYDELGFEERVGLLVDHEWTEREARSLTRRLQIARLRDRTACVEDIDYHHPRGLDRALMQRLATCDWIKKRRNLIINGKTGCGKTFLVCALAHRACREGFSVVYRRLPRLLHELQLARGDGSWPRLLARWAKIDLVIIDDWGLVPLATQSRCDLLEVIEDRHGERSTVIAGQLPIAEWHTYIGDPAVADAALDRLVHNAHHLTERRLDAQETRGLDEGGELSQLRPVATLRLVFAIEWTRRSPSLGTSVRLPSDQVFGIVGIRTLCRRRGGARAPLPDQG